MELGARATSRLFSADSAVIWLLKCSATSESGATIASMRTHEDPSHWNLVSLTIGVLGLALAGLLLYAGAHFVIW